MPKRPKTAHRSATDVRNQIIAHIRVIKNHTEDIDKRRELVAVIEWIQSMPVRYSKRRGGL